MLHALRVCAGDQSLSDLRRVTVAQAAQIALLEAALRRCSAHLGALHRRASLRLYVARCIVHRACCLPRESHSVRRYAGATAVPVRYMFFVMGRMLCTVCCTLPAQ